MPLYTSYMRKAMQVKAVPPRHSGLTKLQERGDGEERAEDCASPAGFLLRGEHGLLEREGLATGFATLLHRL